MRYVGRLVIWCAGGFVFGVVFANTLMELLERQQQPPGGPESFDELLNRH